MTASETPEQAIARYRNALKGQRDPLARYPLLLGLAAAQADAKWFEEAVESCDEATKINPDHHAGFAMLASVMLDQGQIKEASEAAFQALRRAPEDPATLNLATGVALRRGLAEAARKLAEACLIQAPTNQRALAHLGIALAQLGRDTEAKHLIDFDHLLKIDSPPAPPGFDSIESFNRAVVDALTSRIDLNTRHVARTLVGGARLEDTFTLDAPIADTLLGMFTQATRDYRDELAVTLDHPVIKGKPEAFTISSWANIMDGAAYETAHMHEGSWLSGVYYPELSKPADGSEHGGAIEFGGHDFGSALQLSGPTRVVMPQAGMLVLFPSYFYHRTIPIDGPGRRISIAFDAKAS